MSNEILPLLPLRDVVVFPAMVIPLFVGREKSINALEEAMESDKRIMLVAQTDASDDDPSVEDIHTVGTVATILQLLNWRWSEKPVLVAFVLLWRVRYWILCIAFHRKNMLPRLWLKSQ